MAPLTVAGATIGGMRRALLVFLPALLAGAIGGSAATLALTNTGALAGPQGPPGRVGARGATGAPGAAGLTGPQGPAGRSAEPSSVDVRSLLDGVTVVGSPTCPLGATPIGLEVVTDVRLRESITGPIGSLNGVSTSTLPLCRF